MDLLRLITAHRFNLIDSVGISVAGSALSKGYWGAAILALFVGIFISALLEAWVRSRA